MEGIGKEEGKVVEEEGMNQTHDHAQLEGAQEPKPNNSVDSVIVEMQKLIGDSAVEKPSEIEGPLDSAAPTAVLKTAEDAEISADGKERQGGSDKAVSDMDSNVHCESEVCLKVEGDKVGSNAEPDVQRESEVCLKVESDKVVSNAESDVHCENEVCVKVESDKIVSNADSDVHPESEVAVKVESDKVVRTAESDLQPESEVAAAVEGDRVVGNVDSEVQRENEVAVVVEGDRVVGNVDSEVQCESEVAVAVEGDGVGGNVVSEVQRESEVVVAVERDGVAGNVDSDVQRESEVAVEVERDHAVGNVDSKVQHESEVCVETLSEVNVKKEEGVKDVKVGKAVELGGRAEIGEPDSNVDQTAQATMEIEKEDNDGKEGKVLEAGMASKANEAHTNAETDVVNQVEPNMRCDSEVAKVKLTDAVSSKAKPSSKSLTSAEADSVYGKLENYKPRDSKIAKEKLVDVVNRKAKRSPGGPPSVVKQLKANNVCKVERGMPQDSEVSMETESESDDDYEKRHALTGRLGSKTKFSEHHNIKEQLSKPKFHVEREVGMENLDTEKTFLLDPDEEGNESGTEEEQAEFMREVDNFHKEKHLEFKPPKFYKEELNLLKLWRAVIKLGGYEKVTSCKLWRLVGESFNPPKTCTTVSWTFRIFYEKALLEFEKHRWHGSELALPETSRAELRTDGSGSGRTLRDAAARAMQGWHSQRLLGNGEEKPLLTMPKMDKQLKSSGLLKRKKLSPGEYTDMRATKPRLDMTVFDIGPPADWVKINVKRFSDCFEVYALVPGLLREEVHVQSDPVGRLIISGQPMQPDNPWGVTPFKKVVSLPSRIDPHQTSAVVTLNGQLFVRVPFEQSDY